MASKTIREAVAVFPDATSLEDAIDELRSSGFDRPEISLLAAQGTVDEKLDHIYERVSELKKALLDPTLVFARPKDVIAREDFTRDQQRAVLQRWVYDARELEVAEGEGMVGGEPDLMDLVKAALRQLEEAHS